MSLINIPIQPQAYEIIRDQIAIILATEIDNQGVLTYDPKLLGMKVFVEAINPEDKVELPLINISFVKGVFGDLKVQDGTTKGIYTFFIDVYSNAKQTDNERGDKTSALLLQNILGKCRVIIDHPVYRTLAFATGFIFRVNSKEINIRDDGKNDALNSRMGRLAVEVQAQELTSLPDGILLAGSDTTVKINETDDGYFYSVN